MTERNATLFFNDLADARSSFRVLFPDVENQVFLSALNRALDAMSSEDFTILYLPDQDRPDSVEALNSLANQCRDDSFVRQLDEQIFKTLAENTAFRDPRALEQEDTDAAFYYTHALRFVTRLNDLTERYSDLLEQNSSPPGETALKRLCPSVKELHTKQSLFLKFKRGAMALELRKRGKRHETFGEGRVYRHCNGKFTPLELRSIRKPDEFYGFQAARKMFHEHFKAFSEGRSNLPLLITSLPGLGKTQMTISHTLYYEDLFLILPAPQDISTGLEKLIAALSAYPEKKFMIFFDDIDTAKTDWFYFRANIGGTFTLPSNIAITISSNLEFPANISSRGRGFTFPTFDELRCQEMIADFLQAKGMKNPQPELVAVIATDYVEAFGQNEFEELSPRTLVRYLENYRNNPEKSRRMLEMSRGDLIPQPDSQVFHEENVKLMRSIYGEHAVEELRRRALDV